MNNLRNKLILFKELTIIHFKHDTTLRLSSSFGVATPCAINPSHSNKVVLPVFSPRWISTKIINEQVGDDCSTERECNTNITPVHPYKSSILASNESNEDVEISNVTHLSKRQKAVAKQYLHQIRDYVEKGEINKAAKCFKTKVLTNTDIKALAPFYSLIIRGCGRDGLIIRAFRLFDEMRERNVEIPEGVYAGLFYACANCPSRDALRRAKELREFMIDNVIPFNTIHYRAMIRAFGQNKDISTCLELLNEMVNKNMTLSVMTYNALLEACSKNTEAGFQYAMFAWHTMLQQNVKPNKGSFLFLLQCVKDCSIKDPDEFQKILENFRESTNQDHPQLRVDSMCEDSNTGLQYINCLEEKMSKANVFEPNILEKCIQLGTAIPLKDVIRPQDRLILLGGFKKFIECMKNYGQKADIKLYTLLLECIPSTLATEKALLSLMKQNDQLFHVDFFNTLIKKRSLRFDFKNAFEVLNLMHNSNEVPDIVTFALLALGCTNEIDINILIHTMKTAGYNMNGEILGAMLKQTCSRYDFALVIRILHIAKKENIKPGPAICDVIDDFISNCRVALKGMDGKHCPYENHGKFLKQFKTFIHKYKTWLEEVGGNEKKAVKNSRV